jgi:hypothetical protein
MTAGSTGQWRWVVLAIAGLVFLSFGAAAQAQTASCGIVAGCLPAPSSCAGVLFDDPSDDQYVNAIEMDAAGHPVSTPPVAKAPPSVDLVGGWMSYQPDAWGKPTAQAVLQVQEFDAAAGPRDTAAKSIAFVVRFELDGKPHYLRSVWHSAGQDFDFGRLQDDGSFQSLGTTSGSIVDGRPGYVIAVLPVDRLGAEGKLLSAISAYSAHNYEWSSARNDRAPDQGDAASFHVSLCAPPSGPPVAPVAPRPDITSGLETQLRLRVVGPRIRAKSLRGRRVVAVKLQAEIAISRLRVKLMRGKTVAGEGGLERFDGVRRVNLRTPKSLRKGVYVLHVSGLQAGRVAKTSLNLRVH